MKRKWRAHEANARGDAETEVERLRREIDRLEG
jgi:hypothetical protein